MPCPFREKTANQWLKDLLKVPQARNGSKPQLHMPPKLVPSPCYQTGGRRGGHEEEKKQIPVTNMSISQEQGTLLPTLESSQLGS